MLVCKSGVSIRIRYSMERPFSLRKGCPMWAQFLKQNVLKPGLARLGTVAATALVVGGDQACTHFGACGLVTEGGALEVVKWVIAAALVAFDLVVAYLDRKVSK